jgi:hypothetical protein
MLTEEQEFSGVKGLEERDEGTRKFKCVWRCENKHTVVKGFRLDF